MALIIILVRLEAFGFAGHSRSDLLIRNCRFLDLSHLEPTFVCPRICVTSSHTADLGARRSEGPVPALTAEMCMLRHLSRTAGLSSERACQN